MTRDSRDKAPGVLTKIRRVAALAASMRVLEIGCGFGRLTRVLAPLVGEIVAVDISAHALDRARAESAAKNVEYVEGDALEFRTRARFDLVVATAVFEHFGETEQKAFLAGATRWLAKDGRLVLHVPIANSWSAGRRKKRRGVEGPDFTGDLTHRVIFSVSTFRRALAAGGFGIDREWIRYSRLGWPEGWSLVAFRAMPGFIRERFAMEMIASAAPR